MPVKFKLGFMIDAETLFGILAKFLPLENLSVEEVVERHHAPATPRLPKIAKPQLAKPRPKRGRKRGLGLDEGVNGAIMRVLADGEPHRYAELKSAVNAAGYAGSGIGSRIERLHAHNAIERVSTGLWRKAANKDAP
jgi:hypothetical protein